MKSTVSLSEGKRRPVKAKLLLSALIAIMFVLASICLSYAQVRWNPDGNPVAVDPGTDQVSMKVCPDMLGGAFITWEDTRGPGGTYDIYAQRIDADGNTLWSAAAEVICTDTRNLVNPQIVPDGDGGAIITWEDERILGDKNIYAQRVEADGNQLWTPNGQPVCTSPGDQVEPQITTDDAGGAIIAWQEGGVGNEDIYAMRVDAAGATVWPGAAAVCTDPGGQLYSRIAPDDSNGAVITWQDNAGASDKVMAQRVLAANGALDWAGGRAVCTGTADQQIPEIIRSGDGQTTIIWQDKRGAGANPWEIYIQRLNSAGARIWTDDGERVCGATSDQLSPRIIPDGAGGAIVAWEDVRSGNFDMYAQKVNRDGAMQWTADGVAICTQGNDQFYPRLVTDGCYGAIISWMDQRGAAGTFDVYAQRINYDGLVQWDADGVRVCGAPNDQVFPEITGDRQAGAIIAWMDARDDGGLHPWDIYAQKVSGHAQEWYLAEGSTGVSTYGNFETWVLLQNPGDEVAHAQLYYQLPPPTGEVAGPTVTLDPHSRHTVEVSQTVPNQWSVSTRIVSDVPIIAERAMYWNESNGVYRQSAHDSIGVTCPRIHWYMAEGSTGTSAEGGFETWVLVQNPGTNDAMVYITFLDDAGAMTAVTPPLTLTPGTRQTVNAADWVPDTQYVSVWVHSEQPIIAERAMYWISAAGVYRQAADDTIAIHTPSTEWYLAEGSTGGDDAGGFATTVAVHNPGPGDANITVDFTTPDPAVSATDTAFMPARTRRTYDLADYLPGQWSVSTRVTSDKPIVAERSMSWNSATGAEVYRQAMHASIGVVEPRNEWFLAEGSTGSSLDGTFETWVLIQNPGTNVATAQVFYQTPTSATEIVGPTVVLQPGTRQTIDVSLTVPNEWSVSTRVESDEAVIAERAMYWSAHYGVYRQAMHDSIGFWTY